MRGVRGVFRGAGGGLGRGGCLPGMRVGADAAVDIGGVAAGAATAGAAGAVG